MKYKSIFSWLGAAVTTVNGHCQVVAIPLS